LGATIANSMRGLVLCTVGNHRMGFSANEVVTVEAVSGSQSHMDRYTDARRAFGMPTGEGRAVLGEDGASMVVDALEIHQDTVALLGVPFVLTNAFGKSLAGFVQWRELLWPVFKLTPFCAFVNQVSKDRTVTHR
jgi:hypothetical protein